MQAGRQAGRWWAGLASTCVGAEVGVEVMAGGGRIINSVACFASFLPEA